MTTQVSINCPECDAALKVTATVKVGRREPKPPPEGGRRHDWLRHDGQWNQAMLRAMSSFLLNVAGPGRHPVSELADRYRKWAAGTNAPVPNRIDFTLGMRKVGCESYRSSAGRFLIVPATFDLSEMERRRRDADDFWTSPEA